MLRPAGSRSSDRLYVDFLEADFEIGFNLVDLVESAVQGGDAPGAGRVLQDAEAVFRDIEERLVRLGDDPSRPFEALLGELRREMDLAKVHLLTT